jgi:hypothetical protein
MPSLRDAPHVVIPFVPRHPGTGGSGLRPEVRAFGELIGARFVDVGYAITGYWDLLADLWTSDSDFIVVEEDVLPSAELIGSMWTCSEPWCSGSYGRWSSIPKRRLIQSDSSLGCVKFGSVRRRFPDLMARASAHHPGHQFWVLDTAIFEVLQAEGSMSAHLHFPPMRHLDEDRRPGTPRPHDPWGRDRYEADLAEHELAMSDRPRRDIHPRQTPSAGTGGRAVGSVERLGGPG